MPRHLLGQVTDDVDDDVELDINFSVTHPKYVSMYPT